MTSIGTADHASLLKRMPSSADVAARIMARADGDGSGGISPAEFTRAMQSLPDGQGAARDMAALFGDIDADGDGSFSQDEVGGYVDKLAGKVRTAMLAAQEQATAEGEGSKPRDPLDTNRDGQVSMAERLAGEVGAGEGGAVDAVLERMRSDLVSQVYKAMTERPSAALANEVSKAA